MNYTTNSDISGLNHKQIKMAQRLADPTFTGTITELCEEIDVARTTFYDWMDKPEFTGYVNSLVEKYTDSELSRVWKSLVRQCEKGDTQAIKLFFELKGKYKNVLEHSGSVNVASDKLDEILEQLNE